MRLLLLVVTAFILLGCQAQKSDQIQLRWKVVQSPALYSVVNQEIDLIPELIVSGSDALDKPEVRKQVIHDLRNIELPVATYEGRVESHKEGTRASLLAIKPTSERTPLSEKEDLHLRMAEQKAGLIELLGDFSADGTLDSHFLGRRHRSILNLLFSLPSDSLVIGSRWSPDVIGIEIGPRFFPESYRRVSDAVVDSISEDEEGRIIATVFYVIFDEVGGHFQYKHAGDIQELPVDVRNTYFAVGDFLVEQGRWKSFVAVNTNETRGDPGENMMILYSMRLKE